jgi:class 3 adenylate cyclase
VPFCTHCRSPNRTGARYCDACGGVLPGGMCSGCGSPNRNGARFCDACGSLLSRDLEPRRLLATPLFTDIVDSTARSAALGDRGWTELLERHHALVRALLDRHDGRELDTAGDGFFARFDGPATGISCARAILRAVPPLGIQVRIGLHTGECELFESKVGGIAVSVGSRVCAAAAPGEILVTSTVRDLCAGSSVVFGDRGPHALKGIEEPWRLFTVM